MFSGDYSDLEIGSGARCGNVDFVPVVRFRYCFDPLFVAACGCYTLNRWVLRPRLSSPFLRNWFNDLLLIPCALPLVLWIFRRCGMRDTDCPPGLRELLWILAVWSVLFEWIGPHWIPWTTADLWDVLMYWAGGLISWGIWNRGAALE
jgi:hypothetical protein